MTDVNSYPITSLSYTVFTYGDTRKLFSSNMITEMLCSYIYPPNSEADDTCFTVVERHTLKINFSAPVPIVNYLKETGIAVITQDEFSVTPHIQRFSDGEKRTVSFVFSNKSATDDSKYIFYVYSYINYHGIDDIYHLETINFRYYKKVPRKFWEWSKNGMLLPLSGLSLLLFILLNALAGKKLISDKISLLCDNVLLFIIFFVLYSYLFTLIPLSKSYFHPETPYIAGDNATHYNLAKIVREWSLGRLVINTWDNSHFCGYKIFQTYFPLPFLVIALLSWIINFNIAFKIIHISGSLLLRHPVC
ncbi:MAG: hypothetical protein ACK4NF_00465 [Planctomycetota bacterium]